MAEKIRLFIFIHDLAPFGAQRVALYTVKNLPKEDFGVTVVPFGKDLSLRPELDAAGAEVIPLNARRYLDPGAWRRLAGTLFSLKPDIVQTNLPELSVPVRLLALFLPGVRVVHGVHNPFSSEPWYWRWLNLLTAPFCSAFVFSSEGLMRHELRERGSLHTRISAIPNGIEGAEKSDGLRAELGIGSEEKVVCCAARLTRQKGQDILVKSVAELRRRNREIRLVLAGDGEDLERLKGLAERLGVSGNISFLGRCGNIGRLLAAADIYTSASRWESFDIALGEAMLAGLPCVATEISGHEDLLRDGETGISVPPWSPEAMASAIEFLLERPDKAEKLGAEAARRVRSEFSPEIMAERYARLYVEITGGRV